MTSRTVLYAITGISILRPRERVAMGSIHIPMRSLPRSVSLCSSSVRARLAPTSHFDHRPYGTLRARTGPTSLYYRWQCSDSCCVDAEVSSLSGNLLRMPLPDATARPVKIDPLPQSANNRNVVQRRYAHYTNCWASSGVEAQGAYNLMLWQRMLAYLGT